MSDKPNAITVRDQAGADAETPEPCPFCESKDVVFSAFREGSRLLARIRCGNCEATGPEIERSEFDALDESNAKAIAAWNSRSGRMLDGEIHEGGDGA